MCGEREREREYGMRGLGCRAVGTGRRAMTAVLPHTHNENHENKNRASEAGERKLLRDSRAVLDVFRSVVKPGNVLQRTSVQIPSLTCPEIRAALTMDHKFHLRRRSCFDRLHYATCARCVHLTAHTQRDWVRERAVYRSQSCLSAEGWVELSPTRAPTVIPHTHTHTHTHTRSTRQTGHWSRRPECTTSRQATWGVPLGL